MKWSFKALKEVRRDRGRVEGQTFTSMTINQREVKSEKGGGCVEQQTNFMNHFHRIAAE